MAPRPKTTILRWIRHRNSSDYRGLQDSLLGCGVGLLGGSKRSWRTVPGLIDDDESSSIIFDEVSFQQDMIQLKERASRRTLPLRGVNWPSRSQKWTPPGKGEQGKVEIRQKSSTRVDEQSIDTTETEGESEQEEQSKQTEKSVRWADFSGQSLTETITLDALPYVSTRIVILLLDLEERLFEFVQCEFSTDDRLTISDILKQLPALASIEFLAQQRYQTLCRPDHEEMINMLPIQHYRIREGEILVASNGVSKPKDVMAAARALLNQKKLARSVRKAKLSGRALQMLLSSAELLEPVEDNKQQQDQKMSKLNDSCDDIEDSALIVKVLSRELGEGPGSSNFADFSFPAFEAEDGTVGNTIVSEYEGSPDEAGDGWFSELFHANDSFAEQAGFAGDVDLADFQFEMDKDLEGNSVVMNDTQGQQPVDAFGSSSHVWSEQDVANFSFSFNDQQVL